MTHETAEFARESIRRWRLVGRRYQRAAARLLICADGGGNGNRQRPWKQYLEALS
jgi:hypothetical protein